MAYFGGGGKAQAPIIIPAATLPPAAPIPAAPPPLPPAPAPTPPPNVPSADPAVADAVAKQKASAANARGRASTILTSPGALGGVAVGGQRGTLLGGP